MSDDGSDKEREFLAIGAKTYLDVDDAMAMFRRRVQDQITRLVNNRLGEINRVCEMEWTSDSLGDYTERWPDGFNVGKQVVVGGLGRLYFYFGLRREKPYQTVVSLYRQRVNIAVTLWNRATDSHVGHCKGNSLWFERPVSEDEVSDFVGYLNQAIDDFVKFIGDCEGLQKHLPPKQ